MQKLFIFVCLGLIFETQAFRIKAYFPPESAKRQSRLIWSGTLPSLSEVTVCHWIKAHTMKPKGMFVVSYAHGNEDELLTGVIPQRGTVSLVFAVRNTTIRIPTPFKSDDLVGAWHHLCFTWSTGKGLDKGYFNGQPYRSNKTIMLSKSNEIIRSGGLLMIGQDQDVYNGKLDLEESWNGFISDVQIWDEVLTDDRIAALAKCEQREGNIFAWMRNPLIVEDGVVLSRTNLCSHYQKHHD